MSAPVRVMSYNIRHDSLDDDVDWRDRRGDITGLITEYDTTVVGLQEATGSQFADVRERLPAFEWIGTGTRPGEFNPIGYRPDRFSLLSSDVKWLSEHPDDPGSVGWDAAFARVVTVGVLRETTTGARVGVLNTHFDHHGTEARVESARLLRNLIDTLEPTVAAVACGDFNADATSVPYAVMVSGGYMREVRDARDAADRNGHNPGTTRTTFDALLPNQHIDHVFVTPDLAVTSYSILTDTTTNGRYPSDHLPVVVECRLD